MNNSFLPSKTDEPHHSIDQRIHRIAQVLYYSMWLQLAYFGPILNHFWVLYRFDYGIATATPILLLLLFGGFLQYLLWKWIFNKYFDLFSTDPAQFKQLLFRIIYCLEFITGIFAALLWINRYFWQSSSVVMQWTTFVLILLFGCIGALYYYWPKNNNPMSSRTQALGVLIIGIIVVIGLFVSINYFYVIGMIWFGGVAIFIVYPRSFPWEKPRDAQQIPSSLITFPPHGTQKVKGASFFVWGRNGVILLFFFMLGTNIFTLFWVIEFWVYHFVVVLVVAALMPSLFLIIPPSIQTSIQRWLLIALALILLVIPIAENPLEMYFLDIIYGVLLGILIQHFLGDKDFYATTQWISFRQAPGLYGYYFVYGALGLFFYAPALGFIRQNVPELTYLLFKIIITLISVGFLLIFHLLNRKKIILS